MSAPEQLQLAVWRTRELRELLEDDDQIKYIVKCSEKVRDNSIICGGGSNQAPKVIYPLEMIPI